MKTKWVDVITGKNIQLGQFVTAHLVEGWTAQGVLINENAIVLRDEGSKGVREVLAVVTILLDKETEEWVEQVKREYML